MGYETEYRYVSTHAVPSYYPEKSSREVAYNKPSVYSAPQPMVPVGTVLEPAFQSSMQAAEVEQAVSDNPFAALRAIIERKEPARVESIFCASSPNVVEDEQIVKGEKENSRKRWSVHPHRSAKQHPPYNVPSAKKRAAVVERTRSSE